MVRTTKAQRQAIKRKWEQDMAGRIEQCQCGKTVTLYPYKHYRKKIQPTFGMDGAVVLPIWGMFLCIERDGYTHS